MYKLAFKRRKVKTRKLISKQKKFRLTVHKSNKHIYTQIATPDGSKTITSISSLNKNFKDMIGSDKICKVKKAYLLGKLLSNILKNRNIEDVIFDRSGFKFHGRVKAIADSIKENGIKC